MDEVDLMVYHFANEMGRAQYAAAGMEYPGIDQVPVGVAQNLIAASAELIGTFVIIPFSGLPEVVGVTEGVAHVATKDGLTNHEVKDPQYHVRQAILHLAIAEVSNEEVDNDN